MLAAQRAPLATSHEADSSIATGIATALDPAQVERVQLTLTYLDDDLGSEPLVLQTGGRVGASLDRRTRAVEPYCDPCDLQRTGRSTTAQADAQNNRMLTLVSTGAGVLGLPWLRGMWFTRARADVTVRRT